MSSLRLGRYEIEEYELPRVCARCGRKAVTAPRKTFSWHPGWVLVLVLLGLLIYVIVAVILTKRMTVRLPLCERHRNYWRNRAIFIWGGLGAIAFVGIAGVFLASVVGEQGRDNPLPLVCFGTGFLFIIWLFAAAIMQVSSIRPGEVTDNAITLDGLSKEFVRAVREERRGDEEDDDEHDDRPRRKRPPVDDEGRVRRKRAPIDEDDDEPRPRRPAADEDDGGYYDPDARRRRPDRDDDEDR